MPPRGPMPKPDEARQRMNEPTIETTVLGSAPAKVSAPTISRRAWAKIHPEAKGWWRDLLASPQASQFLKFEWRRLRAVLELVNRYWRELDAGETAAAAAVLREVRQQEREFGLTPDARQRMRWQVHDPAAPAAAAEKPKAADGARRSAAYSGRRQGQTVKGARAWPT